MVHADLRDCMFLNCTSARQRGDLQVYKSVVYRSAGFHVDLQV